MTQTSPITLPGIEFIDYERRPFIETICDSPDDDAPLLVYSDWLDDHDENGALVRWWVKASREYVPTINPARKDADFSEIQSASKELFELRGQSACVLASVSVRMWQEKLHPINWDLFREYHKDADALMAQIESAWFAVELAGMRLLPIEAIDAAWSSADAAWSSADAAWSSAYAAVRSAYAAWSSADAAWSSADAAWSSAYAAVRSAYAAWSSADAAGNSAYAAGNSAYAAVRSADAAGNSAKEKLMRTAVAIFNAKWWKEMPV